MLRILRKIPYILIIALALIGCREEKMSDAEVLLSDKQTHQESVTKLESRTRSEARTATASKTVVAELAQQISQKPTAQQRVVYTKLESWSNQPDYYEIAFNTKFDSTITNTNLDKAITFSPKVKGNFVIQDDNIVRFYPTRRFAGDQTYKVTINQTKLLAGDYPTVELQFYNTSPVMKLGQVSLQPTDKADEYFLEVKINHYRGRYLDDDYRNGMAIKVGKQTLELDKLEFKRESELTLTTNRFMANRNSVIVLSADRSIFPNANKRELYYSNSVNEMRKFLFYRASTETNKQGEAKVELIFSKNLDKNQALTGLIAVSHKNKEVDIALSKYMNRVIVTGKFELNTSYSIQIRKGIKGEDGSVLAESETTSIKTYSRNRELEYVDKGIFLSSQNKNAINVKVVNYPKFTYYLWSVQVENIAEMLHNLNLEQYAFNQQSNYYRNDNLNWYGELIKQESIETRVLEDSEAIIELNLGEVVKSDPSKIYILNLHGEFDHKESTLNIRNSYYRDQASKMILFTDLAVSAKALNDKVLISVTDITDASPVKRANIELRKFNNTLLQAGKTDRKGELLLDKLAQPLEHSAFFIVAEKRGATGFLSSSAMSIDDTKFRIERDYSQEEFKLEAFTERSEYRPGEAVNLMVMLRDKDNQIIESDLPVIVTVHDARNAKVVSEKLTDLSEGIATYQYLTTSNTATGSWRMEVEYGNITKYVHFKIETFVPERINVTIKPDKERYSYNDHYLNLTLTSSYLFGAPLVDARVNLDFVCELDYSFGRDKFPTYSFIHSQNQTELRTFNQTQRLKSDEAGVVNTSFKLLNSKESPLPYFVNVNSTVQEEGGRPIERNLRLPASPQSKYIGLGENQYLKESQGEFRIPVVVVDESGVKVVEGTEVEYTVYGSSGYWWWDYDSNFRASFKDAETTQLITQGKITIGEDKEISFTTKTTNFNRFLIEANFVGDEDYVMDREYYNSYWGENPELTEDSSIELKSDKGSYEVGDEVSISIPASKDNKVQITLVKQNRIIKHEVINITKSGDYIYKFTTDKSMVPNVFMSVRVIQGQKDKQSDLPLRLLGIIPIEIYDAETKLDITLNSPTKINSHTLLKGSVDVGVKTKTKYIVSIVDEGLTNRTNYVIPNPWNLFYKQEGYYANDYDNFSFFINAQNLEIYRSIMIGGGMYEESDMALSARGQGKELMDALNRLQETGVTRFEPVSYFLGILETDKNGKGEFEVEIGDYSGALKITVIAANKTAFGKAVEHVIVKDDIVVMPTLPRVLTPLDEFEIPVNIVKEANITSPIKVTLLTNEMCSITSEATQLLTSNLDNQLVIFKVKVKDDIGKAQFTFKIENREFSSSKTIDVGVRLPSAYESKSKVLTLTNSEVKYAIPELGYANSNQTYLSFNQGFEFDADQHLKHSVRYPYGGASHITATTFTQLLLSDFISDVNLKNELDYHINTYFEKIVNFNRNGLYHWAGNWQAEEERKILNAYALHTFLIAREKGYNVNDFVYQNIESYLGSNRSVVETIDFAEAYRLFVLALAGMPDISSLNYYNEQSNLRVDTRAKAMLEMAYNESGFKVKDITIDLQPTVELVIKDKRDYTSMEPTESVVTALELSLAVQSNIENSSLKARATSLSIAKGLQDPYFWNIYDKGWQLFALSEFVKTLPADYKDFSEANFEIKIGDKVEKIKFTDSYFINLTEDKGKLLTIKGLSDNANNVFITVNQVFVPKADARKSSSNNLELVISYTDLNGEKLDVSSLEQGTNFYAEVNTFCQLRNMDVATTFILPSGWEFVDDENHKETISYTSYQYYLTRPDFVDVRDDRAVIYLKNRDEREIGYKFKLVAITKGKFMMPATVSEDTYQTENSAVIKGKVVEVK